MYIVLMMMEINGIQNCRAAHKNQITKDWPNYNEDGKKNHKFHGFLQRKAKKSPNKILK